MTLGRITDEAVEALRSRIGIEAPRPPWNEVASKDAIRHFAHGMGDTNPLWTDEDYARRTKFGRIVAPPTFLFTCGSGPVAPRIPKYSPPPELRRRGSLPGVGALHAGGEWEFNRWVLEGERITAGEALVEVLDKPGRFGGRSIHEIRETTYRDEQGRVVAKWRDRLVRMERDTAKERASYSSSLGVHRYSAEELKAIEEDYMREERRGPNPRYWEDVEVGEELTPVVKGPLTLTDVVTWLMGWGSPYCFAHAIAHEYYRRHPGICIVDPDTNVPDSSERIHWDVLAAKAVGLPAPFDIGPQRVSWFAHLMTNWMGDDGFLKKLVVPLRRPVIKGDTVWCKGKVTAKYIRDGEHLVECELWGETQRGENVSPGSALVRLPSRGGS